VFFFTKSWNRRKFKTCEGLETATSLCDIEFPLPAQPAGDDGRAAPADGRSSMVWGNSLPAKEMRLPRKRH